LFTFRDPIGTLTVTQTPGSAVISLSRSFPNIRHISLKTGGNPDSDKKVNFIRDLGFFRKEPINVKGQTILPWDVFVALIDKLPAETGPSDIRSEARVIVCGKEAGKEVEYTISWIRINNSGPREYIVSSSGLCAAIAAMMLARGQTKGKGVSMPELCIPPEQYLEELADEGMEIEIVRKVRL
jgi:saccharopine dehydrogenase-like NADP-dependent oxidoreductase